MYKVVKSDDLTGITVYSDGYVEYIFCMTRLYPKRTNLPVVIRVDECGILRNVSHKFTPRAKIVLDNQEISITVEEHPKLLRGHEHLKKFELKRVHEGIEYIGRNYDLFLNIYITIQMVSMILKILSKIFVNEENTINIKLNHLISIQPQALFYK